MSAFDVIEVLVKQADEVMVKAQVSPRASGWDLRYSRRQKFTYMAYVNSDDIMHGYARMAQLEEIDLNTFPWIAHICERKRKSPNCMEISNIESLRKAMVLVEHYAKPVK